jgi:hypothetical protein
MPIANALSSLKQIQRIRIKEKLFRTGFQLLYDLEKKHTSIESFPRDVHFDSINSPGKYLKF